jgi:predicted dehydrogenase
MSSPTVGVGVIGLGVGEQHVLTFSSHPDCSIVALCDIDATKLALVAERTPGVQLYSRAEDLIDDPDVDVVCVASYDDTHGVQIVRALRAGKHVFAEKPLCVHPDELRNIREELNRSPGLRLSTNTILRHSPRFRWLKNAVSEHKFGKVYCVEADYVYGRLHKLTDGWRGQIPDYSVTLGGGIHMVDLVLWLTGERPREVMAYGSSLASRTTSFVGTDLVLSLLRFDSGFLAKIGANFASVHPHFHRFVLYGTRGSFDNSPEPPPAPARIWTSRDANVPPEPVLAAYPGVGKGELIPSFIDAVLGRGDPDVTEDEVFAAVSVCLAIDQSVATGQPIVVDYI